MNTEYNDGVKTIEKKKITCDQVAWIMAILERYRKVVAMQKPSISRLEEAAKTSALLELMEILNLDFEDRLARHNAISHFAELYPNTDESPA